MIAGVAAGVLSLGVAGTALATNSGASSPSAHGAHSAHAKSDDTPDSVGTVSDFYNGYVTALDKGDNGKAAGLRKSALTASFRKNLAGWEKKHDSDGVLRSQNVPEKVDVAYDNSGMGHCWTVVTLTWSSGKTTKLHVQNDIGSQKISDIHG